jgi:nicotinate-nucleotide pyrophosphorylase (carboxylating)
VLRSPIDFGQAELRNADTLIALALAEDLGQTGDLTGAATIPSDALGRARFVARAPGVLSGMSVVARLLEGFELLTQWRALRADGEGLERGSVIGELSGAVRSILSLERTALNFLQRLSGIATLTARFVAAAQGGSARILDTRKTTPGWRALEKYAVRCGGGCNHRMGLYDAVLIKDNHLAWLGQSDPRDDIAAAVASARAYAPFATVIEVEVDSLEQLDRALRCRPDIILIDNFGPAEVAKAVQRRDALAPDIELEASGGVTLESVAALAQTGVDRISVGALTHSAPALDIALDLDVRPE